MVQTILGRRKVNNLRVRIWSLVRGLGQYVMVILFSPASLLRMPASRITVFDLNENYECLEDNQCGEVEFMQQEPARVVLGAADARINKVGRDHAIHRSFPRGMTRLVVPLRKSLLCPPVPRPRSGHVKKPPQPEMVQIQKGGVQCVWD